MLNGEKMGPALISIDDSSDIVTSMFLLIVVYLFFIVPLPRSHSVFRQATRGNVE